MFTDGFFNPIAPQLQSFPSHRICIIPIYIIYLRHSSLKVIANQLSLSIVSR